MTDIEKLLKENYFFDEKYYLKKNEEIKELKITPLKHYIDIGIKEDKKPNKDFDPIWYRNFYTDVKENGAIPIIHFLLFGEKEGRFISKDEYLEYNKIYSRYFFNKENYIREFSPNIKNILLHLIRFNRDKYNIFLIPNKNKIDFEFLRENDRYFSICNYKKNLENKKIEYIFLDPSQFSNFNKYILNEFDFEFYLNYYDDLKDSMKTDKDLIYHYFIFGQGEKRYINLKTLLEKNGVNSKEVKKYINKGFLNKVRNFNEKDLTYKAIFETFIGQKVDKIKISEDNNENSTFYLLLAENFILKDKKIIANKLLDTSLYFNSKNYKALEHKGNINLFYKNFEDGISSYSSIPIENRSKDLYINFLSYYSSFRKFEEFFKLLNEALENNYKIIDKNIDELSFEEKLNLLNDFTLEKLKESKEVSKNIYIDNLFLCVGAQKSGTTWLHAQLEKHQDIYFPNVKEIHYFNTIHNKSFLLIQRKVEHLKQILNNKFFSIVKYFSDISIGQDGDEGIKKLLSPVDNNWYIDLFKHNKKKYSADFSPEYALLPKEGFDNIKRVSKNQKIIFIMRDPVSRAKSAIQYYFQTQGIPKEKITEEKIFNTLKFDFITNLSHYEKTISLLDSEFEKEDVLYLFYEDVMKNQQQSIDKICDFLDIERMNLIEDRANKKINSSTKLDFPIEINNKLKDELIGTYAFIQKKFDNIPEKWLKI